MPGVRVPSEQELPDGPARLLVLELHQLYRQAAMPALKDLSATIRERDDLSATLSHEGIRRLLTGKGNARWPSVETLVRTLLSLSGVIHPTEQEIGRFRHLWLRAIGADPEPAGRDDPTVVDTRSAPDQDLHRSIVAIYKDGYNEWHSDFVGSGVLLGSQAVFTSADSTRRILPTISWDGASLGVERYTSYPPQHTVTAGEYPYPAICAAGLYAPVGEHRTGWEECRAASPVRIAGWHQESGPRAAFRSPTRRVWRATLTGQRGPWWEARMADEEDSVPSPGSAVFSATRPLMLGMVIATDRWDDRQVSVVPMAALHHAEEVFRQDIHEGSTGRSPSPSWPSSQYLS